MNRRTRSFRSHALLPVATAVAALLAACGSDDGSPAPAASTSGVVTGSYYQKAKVCIDANNNGRCDSGEASTTTDANGAFTLAGQGPVTAEIGTDATKLDPATNTPTAVAQPLVFRAPQGAGGVVSAVSTELVALMEQNGGDLGAAETTLANRLGVRVADLLADHNKLSDATAKATLQAEMDQVSGRIAAAVASAGSDGSVTTALRNSLALDAISNVVVIYAENRGFDTLYGLYPGANGIPGVNPTSSATGVEPQKDFNGSALPVLPPTWGGVTAGGQTVTVQQAATVNLPNQPYQIDAPLPVGFGGTGTVVDQTVITRDLVHRFYNNQMQINGGKNDKFSAYSDAGGLSMGYYDGSSMAMWKLAQQYVLADNFFMGAFGGSFLNHQYLICACAPEYPNADTSPAKNSISAIDVDANGNFVQLTPAPTATASVLDGAPVYLNDSTLTPKDADGKYYAVNTMQPPYQPSANAPGASDTTHAYADPTKANTLPPQTGQTIGDLLTARNVDWAWYGGAWANTTTLAETTRAFPAAVPPAAQTPNFQFHHQPFNFYARFDPVAHGDERSKHLKDFDTQFLADAAAGTLPPVAFYKPQGNLNQHAGYASVSDGDAHIASVIAQLQQSPQWAHMLIVVTYDENGGFFDHAAVPKADRWGPGTRIPAIIVSPYAKKGFVDKTQYDTASILRFITHRWSLPTLAGLKARDDALVANGFKPMGDLTMALDFTQ